MGEQAVLRETAGVSWRPLVDERRLILAGRLWTLSTVAHTVPWIAMAAFLLYLEPLTFPLAIILIAHAWIIPELYAKRGANVLRPTRARGDSSERTALLLLGDLVSEASRELHGRTGLIRERGRLGTWVVGEQGAVLLRPGRVHCFCVRVEDPDLPRADRIAHLLLALREDERGFATVANQAFSGAPWRLRRRLPAAQRAAVSSD